MAGPHELFLNEILNLLDMNGRVAQFDHSQGHPAGDRRSRGGVHPQGEERLPNRHLDLRLIPRHRLSQSADELGRADGCIPIGADVLRAALALHHQAPGHVISVVVH